MADQVEYFETEFAALVDKACYDVRKRDLEPSIFLSRVTTLRVSDRTEHRSFIQENLMNIPPPVTFEKIWSRLTIYWDFMNYGLLEHVINKLGSEDLKHQMQDYVEELSTFKSSTRLCDFIDSWPCKDNRPSEDELKKIVIKMNHEWTKCTLQDVESFRTALIHKFFLPEFDLILQNANKGCVCVTWLTSPSTATLLQQNLAMDTPFNALSSAEVFTWSHLTESPPPTTMTELFTTFTLNTLVGYLSLYHKPQLKVSSFSDLPPDVYKQFLGLCRMAYEGILNRQQLVFSAANLPTGFSPLSLMQEIPPVYTQGKASSYHFTHLTFLSAIHISQLPTDEQTKQIQDHVDSGHFKMTLRFVAGLTKLANVPPEITRKLREDHDNNLTLLHWLFECKDTSVTIRTLGSDEMVVTSHYSWTPLDHYVTGHVISHSNCPWRLNFIFSSIDDENFELFCQGCATTGGTGCEGYVSSADFSYNDIISKYVQSFVSIPPHILLGMRVLDLSGNKLDGRACDLLATVVPSMSRLEVL